MTGPDSLVPTLNHGFTLQAFLSAPPFLIVALPQRVREELETANQVRACAIPPCSPLNKPFLLFTTTVARGTLALSSTRQLPEIQAGLVLSLRLVRHAYASKGVSHRQHSIILYSFAYNFISSIHYLNDIASNSPL